MPLIRLALLTTAWLMAGCAAGPSQIRVLSYNIHHGEGGDRRVDLARIAAVIREAKPDLVALQEVDKGVARTGRVDQPAQLAELTGLTVAFEKNIDYQGGEYGNAVLSRLPIVAQRNHALPKSQPGEQRGMLEVRVQAAGGREVVLLATHFDYRPDDTERIGSAALVRELLAGRPDAPLILAGDLNDLPDSRVLADLRQVLTDCVSAAGDPATWTYPADRPERRIDYILHNARGLRCLETRVLAEPIASDHRPVLSVFALDEPASPCGP